MTLLQSILLGILQGLTEFIPVSSTAHLLIGQELFGLPAGEGMFSFLVIVQLGTLVSLLLYYWRDVWKIAAATLASLRQLFTREARSLDDEARLGWNLLLASVPALVAGYVLKDAVEILFKTPLLEAGIRLLTAALLLSLAELLSRRSRGLTAMTWLDALIIGLFQIIAVFPGASRSGTTISAGMLRNLDRPSAARFAFLMSIPVLLAAGGYELLDVFRMEGVTAYLPSLAAGFCTAALVGWLAIRWLIAFLNKHSLFIFAAYCALLGLGALVAYVR